MRRREFIPLVAGALVWPPAAHAQLGGRPQRVGVLLAAGPNDSEYPTLLSAFLQRLEQLGWRDGPTLHIEVRWAGGTAEAIRKHALELVALAPDVIVAPGNATAGPLLAITRSVPIVFTIVPDPVGAGFVESLARPGGNATGFLSFEYAIGAKWLELLKAIAPTVTRVAVLRDIAIRAGVGQWSAVQAAAPAYDVEASPINMREALGLKRAIAEFARSANGGLIITSSASAVRHRDLIVMAAGEHKLPAIYYANAFVTRGGLISYGPDRADLFRSAADYVDRILKGEKPTNLPVQAPTKYELAVNLKTATTLGLKIRESLIVQADTVIE